MKIISLNEHTDKNAYVYSFVFDCISNDIYPLYAKCIVEFDDVFYKTWKNKIKIELKIDDEEICYGSRTNLFWMRTKTFDVDLLFQEFVLAINQWNNNQTFFNDKKVESSLKRYAYKIKNLRACFFRRINTKDIINYMFLCKGKRK